MAIPNATRAGFLSGSFNLATDDIRAILLADTLGAFDVDTHQFYSDISAHELPNAGGYTPGAKQLTGEAVTVDNAGNKGVFDGDDIIWATSTLTARSVALIKWTGAAGTSRIVRHIDFGVNKVSSGGDFKIEWDALGILNS